MGVDVPLLVFVTEPLHEILPRLRDVMKQHGEVRLLVPNPDAGLGLYPGERTSVGVHRPYQVWLDVAERLECSFLTPVARGEMVELRLRGSAGGSRVREGSVDRYGASSEFQRVDKLEDPYFLEDMLAALARVRLKDGARVLDVGVNSGKELRLLELAYPGREFEVVGVDVSESALEVARARYPRYSFVQLDVNALPDPQLGRFDLIVSVGTLQSQGVERDRVFRSLLRDHLAPGGSLILGLPNCRYEGGRVSFGARMLNYRQPELSLLLGDLALYRRHLQKHGFRVHVTGKYEVVLTAVPAAGH